MKLKSIIVTTIFLVILLGYGFISVKERNVEDLTEQFYESYVMRVAVYPNGRDETYLFDFSPEYSMKASFGRRGNDNFLDKNLLENIVSEKEIVLTKSEFSKLVAFADNVEKTVTELEKNYALDRWSVLVIYNHKTYEFYYGDYTNQEIGLLVQSVLDISPITINLRHFS